MATRIDPNDYSLVSSMLANSGMSAREVAAELDATVDDVRHAAAEGSKQRTYND